VAAHHGRMNVAKTLIIIIVLGVNWPLLYIIPDEIFLFIYLFSFIFYETKYFSFITDRH